MDLQGAGRPVRRKIGPLEALECAADEDAPVIVLFHGYGADGADLAPLAHEVPLGRRCRWVFPDATLALDFGGRAWFPIDVEAIQEAQQTGRIVDWSDTQPEGLSETRRLAEEFLHELGVPWERLILGGFSQGSMLALDLALHAPKPPRALVVLSGNLVSAGVWREAGPKLAGVPFFQSHGIADPLLGFKGAKRLEALLQESGLKGKLLSFEGGHAITQEVVAGLGRFLKDLAAS